MSTLNPHTIHYEPFPEQAYRAAIDSIRKCGFPENAILEDYSFSSRFKEKPITIKINALAFAHPIHRNPDYASVTLFNAANGQNDEELIHILAESTAPFHLIHRGEQFSFLASSIRNKELEPIHIESHIAYEQLGNVLSNYADDLKPQHIIDVKQGRDTFSHPKFHNLAPLQLSLWAAGVTGPLLVKYFGLAVNKLRDHIKSEHNTSEMGEVDEVTDLAIQLLGATILADTGVLGEHIRLEGSKVSLHRLMSIASSQFSRYFQLDIFEKYLEQAEKAYQLLRQVCYAGFMPDMLRDLYIEAYSEEERKSSGSYDTPLYLTRQIWKNIPVEYLPPNQRVIADITCGWGSFLIAGYERLSQLSDMQDVSLRNYLHGNDKYHFTAKLAGLGLLLCTSEASWNIDNKDAMKWNWLNTNQPNIIVGNPPFRGHRGVKAHQDPISSTTAQKRQQEADKFLRHAIEHLAPEGYLAMVMPRSFTAAEASPELRRDLLKMCDILELWQLPSGIFTDINPQAMVIFARKKTEPERLSHHPVRVRTIQRNTLKEFQDSGIFTASGLVADQSMWNQILHKSEGSENTHIMEYKLILPEDVWQKIRAQCVELEKYADIFRGATVGSRRRYIESTDTKQVFWLTGRMLQRPFHIAYVQPPQTKLYPNEFEEPRLGKQHIFESTKVLVARSPDPSWGRRAKAAIERKRYYVSGSYWVVTPLADAEKRAISHEVLAAIINWDVSNAWLIEHMTSLGIPEYAMNTNPFPRDLSKDDCAALTKAVLQLEDAAFNKQPEPSEATQTIDAILKAAYHLDNATFERLRKITEWASSPETTLDNQPDREKANCFISGAVESIDANQSTITLWINGFEELQTVQIVPSMPGWLLRPGAEFYTKIPRRYVRQDHIDFDTVNWNTFHPQMYTYMSEIDLMKAFAKLM